MRILVQNFLVKNTEESLLNLQCQVLLMKLLRRLNTYRSGLFRVTSFLHPKVLQDF